MKVNLIGVPTYYGCDNNGTQFGPDKLRESKIIDEIKENNIKILDMGNLYVETIEEGYKFKDNKNIKYYRSIHDVNLNLAHTVYSSLSDDSFTIIIGGDHNLALGSISGVSKYYNNLGVIWIDAHGDFNTEDMSESKNAHGMPLAFLCGYGDEKLRNLYYKGKKVKEENVFHIGGRDIDLKEQKLLESTKINMYNKNLIDKVGFICVIEDIIKKCDKQNIEALHISLDIDFLDKLLVTGTGTRVDGGYVVEDLKFILSQLIEKNLVKSLDFVEFNPILDEGDKTLNICKDLLKYIIELVDMK